MARARVEEAGPSRRLSDGTLARIVPSRFAGGYELDVDGTPQSHVDLDDPTHLHFEYIGRMAAVIDLLRMPGQPLTAVHLGAGALTLPRYVEATRPGSRQQVIELEQALVEGQPLVQGDRELRTAEGLAAGAPDRQAPADRLECRGVDVVHEPACEPVLALGADELPDLAAAIARHFNE